MLKERNLVVRRFILVLDALVILCAFIIAYHVRKSFHVYYRFDLFPSVQVVGSEVVAFPRYATLLILVVPIWILTLKVLGIYQSIRTRTFLDIIWIIVKSAVYTTLICATCAFLLKIEFVSRVLFAAFMIFGSFFLVLERGLIILIVRYIRRKGYNFRNLLIVGTGRRAQKFISAIEKHPEWGFRIQGIIDDDETKRNQNMGDYKVLGTLDDIADILHSRVIDEVIFVVPRSWLDKVQRALAICETRGVKAVLAADFFDLHISRTTQTDFEGMPLIVFEPIIGREEQLFIKRALDVIVSALTLIVFSPVFLVTAIAIKMTSKGPVFFVQRRVGRNGRKFLLYKFRSMFYGSHKRLAELEKLNEASGPVFKIRNDPRITPVGRFLRRFSIDEFPQLLNVFMGHMSLVGPRPPLPREVLKYEPWQRRRLSMRPGLTCLWQINGRDRIDFEAWMKLDLQYIDNWSLWLDSKILMKTIPAVLSTNGAH